MEYFIIGLAAFVTSTLTLFSGFGLGTLLMPVFAIFFPIDIAIALTAIVHFLNNLFKLSLLGKHADKSVILSFGLPAVLASFLGAWSLIALSRFPPLVSYEWLGRSAVITPVKLVIAILMVFFAILDLISFQYGTNNKKLLPIGGLLSGFFGGLSGHQGAFRSTFLVKCGLSKESFIGTGVAIACLVDFVRISVYASHFINAEIRENVTLLIVATTLAFLGAWIGNRLMKKVTLQMVQVLVSILLLIIALGLGSGII